MSEVVRVKGKVKWYNGSKGFGFAYEPDNPERTDIFLHATVLKKYPRLVSPPKDGDDIVIDVRTDRKGRHAVEIISLG